MDQLMLEPLLAESVAKHRVPGASLAVLADGQISQAACGVLNRETGVEATTDSLFQIGSITKIWTATLVMQLIAEGHITLDSPVRDVLPDFRVADGGVSSDVTVWHLLCHTSGIDGDTFFDTGRGDDCVARFVARCAELPQLHALGEVVSYSNAGYVILGRIIEVITGKVWDAALRERLIEPLNLKHTVTLPEEALRYRTAWGHLGTDPQPADIWSLPRAAGPVGGICATASDLIAFARMHLNGGRGQDGLELLHEDLVEMMRRSQVPGPIPGSDATDRGLGWVLRRWDGLLVANHNGGTVGQHAFLYIEPVSGTAVALLTNGGDADGVDRDLCGAIFREICGVGIPVFEPPAPPPDVDGSDHAGIYTRRNHRITVASDGTSLSALSEWTDELEGKAPTRELQMTPVTADVWATKAENEERWTPVNFGKLSDGTRYLHMGGRVNPKRQ